MAEIDPQEALEHAEHAHHAAAHNDRAAIRISMTIALMAVLAAVLGSLETTASGEAVLRKNEAVLLQAKASDQWGYFQAHSIKRNMYDIAAAAGGPGVEEAKQKAQQHADKEAELSAQAKDLEAKVTEENAASAHYLDRHHRLTLATTAVHAAIALASLSILVRRRWLWISAIGLSALGVVIGIAAMV